MILRCVEQRHHRTSLEKSSVLRETIRRFLEIPSEEEEEEHRLSGTSLSVFMIVSRRKEKTERKR